MLNRRIEYLIIFIAGMLPLLIANGPGLTHDSREYLYAGSHLCHNGFLSRINDVPYNCWPPLYPVVISGFCILKIPVLGSLVAFQAALHGITSVIMLLILKTKKNRFSLIIALMYAWGMAPLLCSYFIWSESLFLFFEALLIYFLISFSYSGGLKKTVLVAALCALAIMTRYAGIAFVPACLWLIMLNAPHRQLINRIFIFCTVCFTPLFIWLLRNFILYATADEYRPKAPLNAWADNLLNLTHTIGNWFAPMQQMPSLLVALLVPAGIAYCLFALAGKKHPSIYPEIGIFISYFIFIYASTSYYLLDPIDDRLAAPLYLPILLILAYCTTQIQLSNKIMTLLLLASLGYMSLRSGHNLLRWHNNQHQVSKT